MQSRSYGPLAPVGLLPELKYNKTSYFVKIQMHRFKVIQLLAPAHPRFQHFKWLQMEILFASGFDRSKA